MPTIPELITQATQQRDAAQTAVNRAQADLVSLRDDPNLTPDMVRRAAEARDAAEQRLSTAQTSLDGLLSAQRDEDQLQQQYRQTSPGATRAPAYDRVARIGAEARTYRQDEDPSGRNFLTDVSRQFIFGDPGAQERLARHMQEEQVERGQYISRAVGTGAFTGLTVPQYLTDLYAPATAALRPFADAACFRHDLPSQGMTINISRITTSSSAGLQASENTAVVNQDMDDTLLTIPVQTAAGQQTVSRQAIERGSGIDEVTMSDLFNRVATTLDSTLINQATTGLTNVASATTYTSGTPTAAELWPKLQGAAAGVEATLLNMGYATHAVMHSRRWNWLASQVGSSFPFVTTGDMPVNAGGLTLTSEYGPAVRAKLSSGLLVVVDNNIATNYGAGTNQDEIYVVPKNECHLWEDPNAPMFIRAEQPAAASLGVLLVAYSYFGYTFQRYASGAMSKVAGTGLTTPVF